MNDHITLTKVTKTEHKLTPQLNPYQHTYSSTTPLDLGGAVGTKMQWK